MKTDRELLEVAAKAAGIAVDGGAGERGGLHLSAGGFWNPLTDDGDAFRLSVQLDIQPAFFSNVVFVGVVGLMMPIAKEEIGDDKCAATRRAIVKAAAAMQEANETSSS